MTALIESLTEREKECLRLLLGGHEAKTAAAQLGLSVHTVNDHLRSARRKLGVSSSREAARILRVAEESDPENPAGNISGMASASPDTAASPETKPDERGNWSRLAFIAGGIAVTIILAAIALFAFGAPDRPAALAEAAQPGQPATAPATSSAANQALATAFVTLLDRRAWQASWDASGSYFQSQIAADAWAGTIAPLREPLGPVKSRVLKRVTQSTSLPGVPNGEFEILEYETQFEARPDTVETVVLGVVGGKWEVMGYFLR